MAYNFKSDCSLFAKIWKYAFMVNLNLIWFYEVLHPRPFGISVCTHARDDAATLSPCRCFWILWIFQNINNTCWSTKSSPTAKIEQNGLDRSWVVTYFHTWKVIFSQSSHLFQIDNCSIFYQEYNGSKFNISFKNRLDGKFSFFGLTFIRI